MSAYYFVGSHCEIDGGRIKLERLGQRVELSDEQAEVVAKGGGSILPEAEFQAIGFTAQELSDYAFPGQRVSAPETFNEKLRAAWMAFHDHKTSLERGAE